MTFGETVDTSDGTNPTRKLDRFSLEAAIAEMRAQAAYEEALAHTSDGFEPIWELVGIGEEPPPTVRYPVRRSA